jgi:hypothetical protein
VFLAALLAGCGTRDKPADDTSGTGPSTGRPAADDRKGDSADKFDAENRAEAAERLKRIGKAMLDHHGAYFTCPTGYVAKGGELGLSWRVQLLLYFGKEEAELFGQFKLDEPWDGPTNKKLIVKMPAVYASPGKTTLPGMTHLRSFVGETAFIHGMPPKSGNMPVLHTRGRRLTDITDGTSNTLAVAEAPEPVEWTKPDDLPFYGYPQPTTPELPKVPKLGGVYAGGFHGLMADARVVFFPADLAESDLRALITATAGDNFGPNVMKVLYPTGIPKEKPSVPSKGGK